MGSEEQKEHRGRQGTRFLIPAGIMMGLGIGILLNNPVPFLFIGLGSGFVGSSFEKTGSVSQQDSVTIVQGMKPRWFTVIMGIMFILFGAGLAVAPHISWNYFVAAALILFGVWFVLRATGREF